jgi:hypothetical protein
MSSVKLRTLETRQEDLRRKMTELEQELGSYPSDRRPRAPRKRNPNPKPQPAHLAHADALQRQEAAISCVLHRACEGHNVTADELIEQISPDDELVDEARRFMTMFLAILERKGYSSRPAMMP